MSRKHRPHFKETSPHAEQCCITRQGVDALVPEVREVALDLAKGDALRIEVLDEKRALVVNRP